LLRAENVAGNPRHRVPADDRFECQSRSFSL
jgi:hypothetical protein